MGSSSSEADISDSLTLTMAATNAGVILGTAAYMSPEQAKGIAADARSDIFSFGCVLCEMLSGRQLFKETPFRKSGPSRYFRMEKMIPTLTSSMSMRWLSVWNILNSVLGIEYPRTSTRMPTGPDGRNFTPPP
jgi:serine/threonine protein kinase